MAKDGDIIMLGLLAGAAYLAYNWWTSQTVPVPIPVPSVVGTTPVPPTVAQAPVGIVVASSPACTPPLVMVGGQCFPPPLTPGMSGWRF